MLESYASPPAPAIGQAASLSRQRTARRLRAFRADRLGCPAMWSPGPLWIVLPTYNERPNLEPIVSSVLDVLEPRFPDHTVLIVDDSSPDGTGEIADRIAREDQHVR